MRLPDAETVASNNVDRFADLVGTGGRREVKAEPKIDDGAYDSGLLDGRASALPFHHLSGEVEAATRVCLPEVDASAKPIVEVLAGPKFFPGHYATGNIRVTSVISEDECRGQPVPRLTVAFRELASAV